MHRRLLLFAAGALLLGAGRAAAQGTGPLAVGAAAPDFALTGASLDGVLERPVRLSDFRDQTVVIAFFYRARTKG
jgi:cytochrome oxidase Cu insertion factor (SCO1/SenC/PrrC family)